MKRTRFFLAFIFVCLLTLSIGFGKFSGIVFADQIDDLQHQIDDLAHLKQLSEAATTPLEKQVADLDAKIKSAQAGILSAQKQSEEAGKQIQIRDANIGTTYSLFSARVADRYRTQRQIDPFMIVLASQDLATMTNALTYQFQAAQRDSLELKRLATEISSLEVDKKKYEETKVKLAAMQKTLDSSATFFKGEINKAKKYQQELAGKIAALSAQQQAILAERSGTATTTVGDVPLADDPASQVSYNPGFSPAYAVFSFGAPHFKGLSQYGAYGRAKSGQNAEAILQAYYGGAELKKDYNTGVNISVQGYGSVDIETYTKRIYEMPSSWGDSGGFEALKAQAVAARTYALSYTNNGSKSICATESCQVYKPSNKGGKWDEAVNATRGWVLVKGGQPISALYASTSGGYQQSYTTQGYSTPGFWDTTSDWSRWAEGAYEGKGKGNSPWFYKAWYKSRSGDSCGRSHPWLTQAEFADILNAWVVREKGSSGDVGRVTPIGSCNGGNPFSLDEMKNKANELGGAFTSVSSVRVEHGSNGFTKNVVLDTNKGSVTIPGAEFKTAFNLRAPGRISVKGNLFGIEKK
ncbi:MAG: SpoIID/LytB domain-containing protein [Candidatus Woesebacteria bacterium]